MKYFSETMINKTINQKGQEKFHGTSVRKDQTNKTIFSTMFHVIQFSAKMLDF